MRKNSYSYAAAHSTNELEVKDDMDAGAIGLFLVRHRSSGLSMLLSDNIELVAEIGEHTRPIHFEDLVCHKNEAVLPAY
jgi:hypothetical protein